MIRFAKWLSCTATIAAAVLIGTATSARADFELVLTTTDASGVHTATGTFNATNNDWEFSGTLGQLTIKSAYGDGTQGTSQSIAETGTNKIVNNSSSNQTVTITVSETGFTTPTSPPALNLTDTVAFSMGLGGSGLVSGSAQGFADVGNRLGFMDTSDANVTAAPLLSFGAVNTGASNSGTGVNGNFLPGSTNPYSLTFTETFTLSGNATFTQTGGNVTAAVPAPAGLVLALSGLPFLGLGTWLRRRKQVATVA